MPIRTNRDPRYFDDTYQAMPLHGYTRLFERMLAHPAERIRLLGCVSPGEDRRLALERVRAVAGPNVELLGYQPAHVLKDYMQNASTSVPKPGRAA